MITNVDIVTIFNGRADTRERRRKYIPTVIRGVSYVESKGSTVADNGVWSPDVQYKIRVPLSAEMQEHRAYVPWLRYAGLDDEGAAGCWTIGKEDLMVLGEYAGASLVLHEDEVRAYAKAQGLDVIRITEYADNTAGGSMHTRHWRIGGK